MRTQRLLVRVGGCCLAVAGPARGDGGTGNFNASYKERSDSATLHVNGADC